MRSREKILRDAEYLSPEVYLEVLLDIRELLHPQIEVRVADVDMEELRQRALKFNKVEPPPTDEGP